MTDKSNARTINLPPDFKFKALIRPLQNDPAACKLELLFEFRDFYRHAMKTIVTNDDTAIMETISKHIRGEMDDCAAAQQKISDALAMTGGKPGWKTSHINGNLCHILPLSPNKRLRLTPVSDIAKVAYRCEIVYPDNGTIRLPDIKAEKVSMPNIKKRALSQALDAMDRIKTIYRMHQTRANR